MEAVFSSNLEMSLDQLGRRSQDFSAVFARVEDEILKPMRRAAWVASGLHSITGELEGAVAPWHGKVSAGITLKRKKDYDLVPPKAVTHTFGRKKFSNKQGYERTRVKRYDRRRGEDRHAEYSYRKRKRSPWGDIPARPFFPEAQVLAAHKTRVLAMIEEYLHV
jgi:hypothetical protein